MGLQTGSQCAIASLQSSHSNLAGWILLGLLAAIIIADYWLYKSGRPTISQWLKRKTSHPKLLKVFGIGLLSLLMWHLFFGGPL